MKIQRLILSAVTAWLMVGASSAAMAVDCPNGRIIFDTVPEIVIDGQSCFIYAVTVEGKVKITNSPVLNMSFTDVGGPMTIENGENAVIIRVDVLVGNLRVSDYESATVLSSDIDDGAIASFPSSPVRMRIHSAKSSTKILPSPIFPVLAPFTMASIVV